ncbi:MAG: hypothetical protein ABW069_17160 [Duganella sp.]
MELFNKSGILVVSVLVAIGTGIGWHADRAAPRAIAVQAGRYAGEPGLAIDARRLQAWAGMGQPVAGNARTLRCWADFLLPPAQIQLFDIPAQCLAQAPAHIVGGDITE